MGKKKKPNRLSKEEQERLCDRLNEDIERSLGQYQNHLSAIKEVGRLIADELKAEHLPPYLDSEIRSQCKEWFYVLWEQVGECLQEDDPDVDIINDMDERICPECGIAMWPEHFLDFCDEEE